MKHIKLFESWLNEDLARNANLKKYVLIKDFDRARQDVKDWVKKNALVMHADNLSPDDFEIKSTTGTIFKNKEMEEAPLVCFVNYEEAAPSTKAIIDKLDLVELDGPTTSLDDLEIEYKDVNYQAERMYSEEEVLELIDNFDGNVRLAKKWFEGANYRAKRMYSEEEALELIDNFDGNVRLAIQWFKKK
jgi:hypothetical protein